MADTFWAVDFWASDFWATGFWAGAPVPAVEEPSGGGRRIYDPDDRKRKNRKLNKREREDPDRMFRERVAPRDVQPRTETPAPTRRARPVVVESPTAVELPPPVDRVTAAKQFLALDALDDILANLERAANENARAVEVAHIRAKQHARYLEQEQQRLAAEAEAQRLEAERVWLALEAERIRQEAEDELMGVLLAIHEAV